MRIGLVTDSPDVHSGYATQARLFAKYIAAEHELFYIALSYNGEPREQDGYTIVGNPNPQDPFMNTSLPAVQRHYGLEAITTLKDPYVFEPNMLKLLVNWFPFVPIDTEPISPILLERIKSCKRPIAFSINGVHQLAKAGYEAMLMPLAYDSKVFYPIGKYEAREMLSWPQDRFMALFIGANQSRPSRKGIENMLRGWKLFADRYPGQATLYMHTRMATGDGINIYSHVASLGLEHGKDVTWTDQAMMAFTVPTKMINVLYNAADITINLATGGGFELALLESQAVGTPVLTNCFTAMRDLVFGGVSLYQNGAPEANLQLSEGLQAHRLSADAPTIASGIEALYHRRYDTELAENARKGAMMYEVDRVYSQYWSPYLKKIQFMAYEEFKYRERLIRYGELLKNSGKEFAEQVYD